MSPKLHSSIFPALILTTLLLIFIHYSILSQTPSIPSTPTNPNPAQKLQTYPCNLFDGAWLLDPGRRPAYDDTCPFHRNAWNCLRNKRENMERINEWRWAPGACELPRVDPERFLGVMRGRNLGFVGDSLNENFVAALLCVLKGGDGAARKWKRKGAWRGAYFPKFNVTVGYHRAVLLARYQWQPKQPEDIDLGGLKGIHPVDTDIPADDWASIANFYDVLIFNTGHWWGHDKFPKEKPLVFYESGNLIMPPLDMLDGFRRVLKNMASYIEKEIPSKTLKFWRLQSPRHFLGGDWNQNGSCLFDNPLNKSQLDLWFDPANEGVNKEARLLNDIIKETLRGTSVQLLDLSRLSEFRADAHPATWLGRKDAVEVWGQDCMHWCLPGVPDTWVDILAELIQYALQ
uniref:Trichome birefringence-like N-terminal domain-containing protein n=1 Tax=Kalanchoe fedtschenkoi TaxID=63787 RepID=A0A7N0TNV8_KALFE